MKTAIASLLLPMILGLSAPALADGSASLTGTNWQLSSLGSTVAAEGVKTTMQVAADGTVSGNGGCNGYGGSVKVTGNQLVFSQMRSTMMACEEKAMQQVHGLHQALEATKSFEIQGQTLTLLDGSGAPTATFEAGAPA